MMAKRKAGKAVEHRITTADLAAAPDLAQEGIKEGDLIEVAEDDGVPTYTLRADSAFGIRCMVMARDLAIATNDPDKAAIIALTREFDLYEEQHRGQ